MNFNDRLGIWIGKRYKNVNQAAPKLGVSTTSIHGYIEGTSNPTAPFFQKLLRDGCNLNWLLGGGSDLNEALINEIEQLRKELEETKNERDKAVRALTEIMMQVREAGVEYKPKSPIKGDQT